MYITSVGNKLNKSTSCTNKYCAPKMFSADRNAIGSRNRDYAILLTIRLFSLSIMVGLLTVHVRTLRVFRWEQTVSGGLIVTYIIAVLGLAICAGTNECGAKLLQLNVRSSFDGMKWLTIAAVVVVLRIHYRCLMMLRWRRSPAGIVLIANSAAFAGLTYFVAMEKYGFIFFYIYLCSVGGLLLLLNATIIWRRWQQAGDLTRVVAELLGAVGVPLQRQILIKAALSAAAAMLMLMDLLWILINKSEAKSKQS